MELHQPVEPGRRRHGQARRRIDTAASQPESKSTGRTDVSLALVEVGLAWHYTQYSDDQVLAAAELVAREKKVGVWSLPNPVPPWQHRSGVASARSSTSGPYHGNSRSKVYHALGCQYFDCKNCTVNLASMETAARQGFRPHERCVGVATKTQASSRSSATSSATASTSASSTIYHGNKKMFAHCLPVRRDEIRDGIPPRP